MFQRTNFFTSEYFKRSPTQQNSATAAKSIENAQNLKFILPNDQSHRGI